MGHQVDPGREYRLLQQRLDRNVTGAPDSPALMRILKTLYSPEEAKLASRLPTRPATLDGLTARTGLEAEGLDDRLTEMARKGLVVDIERHGKRFYSLSPVVIGFFEFTFMRTGNELGLGELARLFDEYMTHDDRFARAVFQGETQLGRSLLREEVIPDGDHTEVLDWERASRILGSASSVAVGLCACRHKASHLGKACDAPMEACLSLGNATGPLVRNGFARSITVAQGLRILERCKDAGLAQTADNVKHGVSYICNCCGCCCGMMQAIRLFDLRNAVVSSNWVVEVDRQRCTGCGKCEKACPVRAMGHEDYRDNGEKRRRAVLEEDLCLGCGVCTARCDGDALTARSRPRRVYTPETMFDRYVAMAIERGKLADLLFEDPEKLSHRALGRVVRTLERSSPFKAAMAIEPLRSTFLRGIVKAATRS
jgi:NAD-dependent dihydropyrimidine dehydrogenase PreA subunit